MAKANTAAFVLTAALEKLAVTEIKGFAADFKKTEKGIGSMSDHLLTLAKAAEKTAGTDKAKRDSVYKALCRHAETVYKQEHTKNGEELPIKQLLPFWPVAKSQVQAGMNAGLKMSDYKTVYEVTAATPKKERAVKTPDADTGKESGGDAITVTGDVPGSKELVGALDKLHKTLKAIMVQRPGMVPSIATQLAAFVASIDEAAKLMDEADAKTGEDNGAGVDDDEIPTEAVA